ncbi:MAG: chorismate synthase [Bdellovibrionota bacterium]
MSGANSFGSRFILTTFGESHGPALGAVIDGVPAGLKWNEALLLNELERRRPGQSNVVTSRNEGDRPEVLSGVHEGRTLGTPIAIVVRNTDARSEDYKAIARSPRAGHADDVWKAKFGHSDPRGGGRSSGRETVSRVMGGAVARMFISRVAPKLKITGFARQIGPYELSEDELDKIKSSQAADKFVARFPSRAQQKEVEKLLLDAKSIGLSYGGVAEIWIDGLPRGLGQPVFRKLKADFASAMMSIGATIGVEFGEGFSAALAEGSEFHPRAAKKEKAGRAAAYGGVRGGLSTGDRLVIRVAFKPTSSVLDVAKKGRHDPCIVPRAIPVLEAMAALVIADHLLWARTDRA